MFMRSILIYFCLFAFASTHAQEAEKEPVRGIQIRGFALGHFNDIDVLELRHEKRTLDPLLLPTGQLKQRISVPVRQFAFGITDENQEFKAMGNVTLPEIGRDFILVFIPIKTGYRVFPVRVDDPEFRGDDAYLFNFSSRHLGILLGSSKQTVKPLETIRLRPSFPEDATFYQALFTYEEDGKYHPFSNTRWPVNPNVKALIFVYENPTTEKMTYRSVTELAK